MPNLLDTPAPLHESLAAAIKDALQDVDRGYNVETMWAMVDQLKDMVASSNRVARVQNAKLMAVTDAPDGIQKLTEVLKEAKAELVADEREACAVLCDEHFTLRANEGFVREATAARTLAKKIRERT